MVTLKNFDPALKKKLTHRFVGERRENTPERVYNAAGRGNGRRIKPAVRDWQLKKQYMPYGGFELIMVPRMITTVTLNNRNRCKRQAHNR